MADWAPHFKEVAEANFFEVVFAGTLCAHPVGVPSRVLLEVEPVDSRAAGSQGFTLLQHRHPEWTARYANRVVSEDWIKRFLHANRGVAWFIAEAEAISRRARSKVETVAASVAQEKEEHDVWRARVEAEVSERNARIVAANVAAGLDEIEDGSRPVSYYEYFLANTVQGGYARGQSGLFYPTGEE